MVKKIFGAVAVVALAFAFTVNFAAAATYNFTQDLTVGSQGAEVVMLQDFLISKNHLVMPAGVSKGYFGSLTASALAKYQASVGITPAAGYFGMKTRTHFNNMEMGGSTGSNNGGNSSGDLSGGDGDFRQFDVLGSPSNEDIEEGETVDVLGFEFEANKSDLQVERVDVLFFEDAENTKPWKVFEDISLVDVDGDEIASVDGSDEDNWEEEDDDQYSVRFEDVDYVVEEGDEVRIYVAVTASDDLDEDEIDLDWTVSLMDDGVRALNAEGIDVYEGNDADTKSFALEVAAEGEFDITVDENDNEDEEIEVSEDDDTEGVILYTAMIESDEGTNLIEEITVDIATTSGTVATLSDIVKTLYLWVDGDEVGSESVDSDGADSVVFDDLDIEIEDGDEVELQVSADINDQGNNEDNFENGAGVYVSGISVDYVDEQDDDLTETDTTDGGDISFSLDALTVDFVSDDSVSPVASDEAKGRFYVTFKVTAPDEEDIYIPKGATTSTTVGSGQGAEFIVVDGNGTTATATTTASNSLLTKVSGGTETGGYYKITKGNTAEFKLDVVVDNTGATSARTLGIQLTGINYNTTNATADTQYTSGLDEDFRSSTEYLLTSNTSN